MIIAGSASEAIITSRLEPMPPKLVPTSMPGERQEEARAAEQRDDGDQIGRPARTSARCAKVGTSAAATQVAAKIR